MKKILVFSLAYYPKHASGAEVAIKEISDRIEDVEFHLITLLFDKKFLRTERIGNVFVYRVGWRSAYLSKILFIPLAAFKAKQLTKSLKPDAMWAMMTYMLFPLRLARAMGVTLPYVLTLQDGDPYEKVFMRPFVRPFVPLLDAGMREATTIQVISSYLATWPILRGSHAPVTIIPNGADPEDMDPNAVSDDEVERIKRELGKKEGDVYLLNTARLVHQKANDITIRALALLPEYIHLVLVGSGADESMLRALAEKTGVSERVHFVGQQPRNIAAAYRRACDIFVCTSRSEGLGIALLSAMAARLPLIATQEGGIADFLFDEEKNPDKTPTGWAVSKDSPEEIASAVKCILDDPLKTTEVTKNAYEMVLKRYDWDIVARQMNDLFRSVVSGANN